MTTIKASDEVQISALIDERVRASRTLNLAAATRSIASDVVLFDVVDPLYSVGLDALKARATAWFSTFDGPIGFEMRDLRMTIGDDVAFSHCLSHVKATKPDGNEVDMWWRSTVCYGKLDGTWMVVHEHNSVPLNPESGKASTDLQP
jgi:uncharacterized protein (TIGR02246 family)